MTTSPRPLRGLLLLLAYYVVVLPVGITTRLLRDPLRRRLDRRATSYWIFLSDERDVA
jgi:hypothetical protein